MEIKSKEKELMDVTCPELSKDEFGFPRKEITYYMNAPQVRLLKIRSHLPKEVYC